MSSELGATNTFLAYVKTAAGDYIELEFRVPNAGEARYLAKRAQRGGQVIGYFYEYRRFPSKPNRIDSWKT